MSWCPGCLCDYSLYFCVLLASELFVITIIVTQFNIITIVEEWELLLEHFTISTGKYIKVLHLSL